MKTRPPASRPAVDEWGLYDPEQAGFAALLARLDAICETAGDVSAGANAGAGANAAAATVPHTPPSTPDDRA